MKTPEVFTYIKLYAFFKLGHLPFEGSLMDQPSPMMQAFQIIEEIDSWRQKTE